MESTALTNVDDPEVARRCSAIRDAGDVDLDLVVRWCIHHIDVVDVDVVQRLVDDRDIVPGLLEVEDRCVAPDLPARTFVLSAVGNIQFIGIEEDVAASVVHDRVKNDIACTDRGTQREGTVGGRTRNIHQLDNGSGRVDMNPWIGFAEQDRGGFPIDLTLNIATRRRVAVARVAAIERSTTATAVTNDRRGGVWCGGPHVEQGGAQQSVLG